MAEVLYRKYRSQNFDELLGQQHITGLLKNAIKSGSIAHAYLFVGSRGTGKTSAARILAKALNCSAIKEDGNPCCECHACLSIVDGSYMDLIEVDAASNRGIEKIRELKERVEYAPAEGKYKVYIIDEVHMLTTEAFNALLKTLEEPPAHAVFILATTDVHKLPATILSRCQRYDFRLGGVEQIRDLINAAITSESVPVDQDAIDMLVESANGSYRDALSLLDVVVSGYKGGQDSVSAADVRSMLGIPDSSMVSYMLESISNGDSGAALDLVHELESKGINLQQFVKYILETLRRLLIAKMKGSVIDEMPVSVSKLALPELLKYTNAFLDVDRKLKDSSMPLLMIEIAIASLMPAGQEVASVAKPAQAPLPVQVSESNKAAEVPVAPEQTAPKPAAVAATNEDSEIIVDSKEIDADNSDLIVEGSASTPEVSYGNSDVQIIDFETLNEKWLDFLGGVQGENPALYAFLKCAKVVAVRETDVILDVPFEFHKDRIESHKTREAFSAMFADFYGMPARVVCNVNTDIQNKNKVSADVILKNMPKPAAKPQERKPTAQGGSDKEYVRKPNKKVEAIFAGM